jgi:hypothetical protein
MWNSRTPRREEGNNDMRNVVDTNREGAEAKHVQFEMSTVVQGHTLLVAVITVLVFFVVVVQKVVCSELYLLDNMILERKLNLEASTLDERLLAPSWGRKFIVLIPRLVDVTTRLRVR